MGAQDGRYRCHRHSCDTAAIGALKTIGTAQSLYRESDRDGNGELDYAGGAAAATFMFVLVSVVAVPYLIWSRRDEAAS